MMGMLLQLSGLGVTSEGLMVLFSAVIGAAGVFVAYQAYRGYQRNESRPMLYLALGIVLVTAIPAGIHHGLSGLTTATDAEILVAITAAHFSGVIMILHALTRG